MPAPRPTRSLGAEFEALYNEHFAFVWRMLVHFGVPAQQVEDAVQDVFVVVHRRFDDWDQQAPRSWLYGIARRVASGHRRSRARHLRKLDALPSPEPLELERQLADRELLDAVNAAVCALEPGLRDVFVMAEIEGMSAREIGQLLSTNPNTVASRLRKARTHVARALARGQRGPLTPRTRDRPKHQAHGRQHDEAC